ncbi:MAG: hypothetical protein ACREAC_01505, partial [Blastocatellia bacterium]
ASFVRRPVSHHSTRTIERCECRGAGSFHVFLEIFQRHVEIIGHLVTDLLCRSGLTGPPGALAPRERGNRIAAFDNNQLLARLQLPYQFG